MSKIFKVLERKSDRLVKKSLVYFENSEKLFILLAPYRSDLKLFARMEKVILARRQSFIAYRFPSDILSSDYKLTHETFRKIKADVLLDLENLKKEYAFKESEIMGFSLGCVPALMIANGNSFINKIRLVVPGHCLAESLWQGCRTRNLRRGFERKGLTLEELKRHWKDLAPENNLDRLEGKRISIFLSEADNVIPYNFGVQLARALERQGLAFKLRVNKHLGHYLTVASLLFSPARFLKEV